MVEAAAEWQRAMFYWVAVVVVVVVFTKITNILGRDRVVCVELGAALRDPTRRRGGAG